MPDETEPRLPSDPNILKQESDPKATMASSTGGAVKPADDQIMARLAAATNGEYRIEKELGRGGMATVYLAHDLALDRKVAIKVMSQELYNAGDVLIDRFLREARTGAKLNHPHIIPVYAIREMKDLIFFVMKFIDGKPLDEIIRDFGPLPVPLVTRVIAQVADALAYAHRNGIIHRDIKPGNLLLDKEGWVVLTDLGIAKVMESSMLTATGSAIGTPTYMSPEQSSGVKELTGSADQYSLGCVAFEMLTGQPPFTADSYVALIFQHHAEAPPAITKFRSDVPGDILAAVYKMLEKDPEDRYQSLEEVAQLFRNATAGDEEEFRLLLRAFATGSGTDTATHRIHNTPHTGAGTKPKFTPRPPSRPSKREVAVDTTGLRPVPREASAAQNATLAGQPGVPLGAAAAAAQSNTQQNWPRTLLKPPEQKKASRRFRAPGILTIAFVGFLVWFFAFPRVGELGTTLPGTTALMEARQAEAEAAVRRGTANGAACEGIKGDLPDCRQHVPVAMSEIAPVMAEAVIVSVDSLFNARQGNDWAAMRRAAGYPRDAFEWGNSVDRADMGAQMPGLLEKMGPVGRAGSLTQHVAQIVWFPADASLLRKFREILAARRLASSLSKERILEIYLNSAEFGPGLYGVEAAAQAYFKVPAKELTKAQAATLAATLATPRTSTPTLEPAQMRKRQALILRRLNGEAVAIPSELAPSDSTGG